MTFLEPDQIARIRDRNPGRGDVRILLRVHEQAREQVAAVRDALAAAGRADTPPDLAPLVEALNHMLED